MNPPNDIAIEFKNVFEKYELELTFDGKSTRESFEALRDISFAVKKGESVAIIGPNGSGKSTLLRLIAGLLAPEKGEVKVHGRVGSLLDLGAGFHPELTGRDNLLLNASLYHFSRKELDEKYEDILKFAGIGKFINAPVRCYSQGMYVRLAFSLAIHVDPDIILIDDCLAVGDDSFRLKCIDKVLELQTKHKTIVLVTHDLELAKQICSRGIYLRDSQIVQDGAIHEVASCYSKPLQVDKKLYQYLGAKISEEERQKLEEERRVKAEEERQKLEEEKRVKAEEERRRIEEEKRVKLEEERQRLEAENPLKEAEERLRLAEEKWAQSKAERQRFEEERLEVEKWVKEVKERHRLEEEKWAKAAEERHKLEEEEWVKATEERHRLEEEEWVKATEERQQLEAEKWVEEMEERQKLEEGKWLKAIEERQKFEEERRTKADEEWQRIEEERRRVRAEEERQWHEVENRQKSEEEKWAKGAEERHRLEEEKWVKEAEEHQRLEAEKWVKEMEERQKLEEEKWLKAVAERQRFEEERRIKADEEWQKTEEERLKAEEWVKATEERQQLEAEKWVEEMEERQKLEEGKWLKAIEERQKFEEERRTKADEEWQRIEEERRRVRAEEERQWHEVENRQKSEEEKWAKGAEERHRLEEEKWVKEAEEHQRLEAEKWVKEMEERQKLEEEKWLKAVAERQRFEEERRIKADEEWQRIEDERRVRAAEERQKLKEEKWAKAEAERQRLKEEKRAKAEAERQRLKEEKRQKLEAKKRGLEGERMRLEKVKKGEECFVLRGTSLKFIINSSKVRILHHNRELTSYNGVGTRFTIRGQSVASTDATWRIKKISDKEVICFLRWTKPEFLFQVWRFKSLSNGAVDLEIMMRTREVLPIDNEIVEYCLGTPCGIFDEERFHNKATTFFCSQEPGFKIETLQKDQVCGVSVSEKDCFRPYFLTVSEHHSLKKAKQPSIYFKGRFSSGVKTAVTKSTGLASCKLESARTKIAFFDGSCQLLWGGKHLTTGLGIYTSLHSKGIWYDSAQARWKVIASSRERFVAEGFWPWIPVAQVWEVFLKGGKEVLLKAKMKVFQEVPIDIQETVVMLSGEYDRWSAGKGIKEFPEGFTSDDFFRFCLWANKADGVSSLSSHSDHLPAVTFKPGPMPGHRVIVENSALIHDAKSRLFHCLRVNKGKGTYFAPGEYEFFKGSINIKEEKV